MNIRGKLILLFVSIVALISLVSTVAIYFFSADYREDDFYHRLENKGRITARLLIEVDEVDENLLKKIEENNPISLSNEKITIYDFRNKILYTSDDDKEIKVSKELLDQVRLEDQVRFRQGLYEGLSFLYTDKYDRFVVMVAATDIYGLRKLKNLRTILLIVFAANVFIIFISGYLYAGRALQPINKVIQEVDDISATNLNRRLDEGKNNDEIERLAHTFNNMLGRLETAFVAQRNFIANASHELRNPITATIVQIDVCLLSDRTAPEYKNVLVSLREDIIRLKTVSNSLLMLAQASMENADKRLAVFRADQLLWEAKSELLKLRPDYTINVELDASIDDESKLQVFADEQLLKSAFSNLMDNGCKYSADLSIQVNLISQQNAVLLEFKDRGIGIPAEDLPHITEPFFRGKNVGTIIGNGIGLSLVNRIVRSHQGSMEIKSLETGTQVTILIPTAAT